LDDFKAQRANESAGNEGNAFTRFFSSGRSETKDANDKKQQELEAQLSRLRSEQTNVGGAALAAKDPATVEALKQFPLLKPLMEQIAPAQTLTTAATEKAITNDDTRGIIFKKQYDYQAKVSNENTKATYAVLSGIQQLAAAQGKPITIDATGVASTINKLSGLSYAKAV
jgi:hypothetical protein